MKKLIIVCLVLFSGNAMWAQLQMGLRGGVNFQSLKFTNSDTQAALDLIEEGEFSTGYHAGIYTRFHLFGLTFQPEAIYTRMNSSGVATISGSKETVDVEYNRMDIPLLVGITLGPLRPYIGPVASFNLADISDFEGELNHSTWGYQLGLGIDIKKLSIELRYEGPISDSAKNIVLDGTVYPTDTRTSQYIVGLAYKLF